METDKYIGKEVYWTTRTGKKLTGITKSKDGNEYLIKKTSEVGSSVVKEDDIQGIVEAPAKKEKKFLGIFEEGGKIPVMEEETYLAINGASKFDIGESALHKNKGNNSDKTWKKMVEAQAEKDRALIEKRAKLREEYWEKIEKGEFRQPTRIENLISKANGHEDLESTQAARRLLAKQNINWKDGSPLKMQDGGNVSRETEELYEVAFSTQWGTVFISYILADSAKEAEDKLLFAWRDTDHPPKIISVEKVPSSKKIDEVYIFNNEPLKPVILNENIFGYLHLDRPNRVEIIHASILKGAGVHRNEPYKKIEKVDTIRLATDKDYDEFRIYKPTKEATPYFTPYSKKNKMESGGLNTDLDSEMKFENYKKNLIKYSESFQNGEGYSSRLKGATNKKGDKATGEYLVEKNNIDYIYMDAKGKEYVSSEAPSFRVDLTTSNIIFKEKGGLIPINEYKIVEGFDHFSHNPKPLFQVVGANDENWYVGEWHATREEAEQELKEVKERAVEQFAQQFIGKRVKTSHRQEEGIVKSFKGDFFEIEYPSLGFSEGVNYKLVDIKILDKPTPKEASTLLYQHNIPDFVYAHLYKHHRPLTQAGVLVKFDDEVLALKNEKTGYQTYFIREAAPRVFDWFKDNYHNFNNPSDKGALVFIYENGGNIGSENPDIKKIEPLLTSDLVSEEIKEEAKKVIEQLKQKETAAAPQQEATEDKQLQEELAVRITFLQELLDESDDKQLTEELKMEIETLKELQS